MSSYRLTYCGNVHPAEDVTSWIRAVQQHAVPVADSWRRETGQDFGLGTWWNRDIARELHDNPGALSEVRDLLMCNGLGLWTLNVFPFGAFHGQAVKTMVYEPDWLDEERLLYTRQAAEVAARLAQYVHTPETITMSTLPLGYRTDRSLDEEDWRLMGRNLARSASGLAAIEERHGVHLQLCLEPEPFCLLETLQGTAQFLEDWVFCEDAWTVSEAKLRRHIGVCVDLCHAAVMHEDALAAIRDLQRREIAVGKIQVSSCLEVRDAQDKQAMDRLLAFDERVYLHQTVGRDGYRALDLPELAGSRQELSGLLRTHFHVPVFWDEEGAFGSTQAELCRVLAGLPELFEDGWPQLEVETYTWGVLPEDHDTGDLTEGLLRELRFVAANLEKG